MTSVIKAYGPPASNALRTALPIGIYGVKPEDLTKGILPDAMEPALETMADVRAYFHVAYKQFADNIPLAIDHKPLVRHEENGMGT